MPGPMTSVWPPPSLPGPRVTTMTPSLCESCRRMREVISGKGSRFLLCELSQADARFEKYPAQPVPRCEGYVERDVAEAR